jgi:hypothetical protein
VNDAKHRRDDAEGRQAVGDRVQRVNGLEPVVGDGLNLFVHQGFDLVRLGVADDDEAAIVADEGDEILVGQQTGKGFEDFRFLRVLEVVFNLAARFAFQLPHQRMEGAENIEEVAPLGALVEDRLHDRLAAILDGLQGIGDHENA